MTELRTATEKLSSDLGENDILPIADDTPATGLFRVKLGALKAWLLAGGGGSGVPDGGTTGQVLTKLSDDDGDADWADNAGGGGGGGGALSFISDTSLNGLASKVLTIPAGYKYLKMIVTGTAGGGAANLAIRINGRTDAIYSVQRTYTNRRDMGNLIVSDENRNTDSLHGLMAFGSTGISGVEYNFLNPTDSNWKLFQGIARQAGEDGSGYLMTMVSQIADVAVISSIELLLDAGTWTGASVQLYGISETASGGGSGSSGIQSARMGVNAYALPGDTNHKIPLGSILFGDSMCDAANNRFVVPAGVDRAELDWWWGGGEDQGHCIVWFKHFAADGSVKESQAGAGGTRSVFYGYMSALTGPCEVEQGDYFEVYAKIAVGQNIGQYAMIGSMKCWKDGPVSAGGGSGGGSNVLGYFINSDDVGESNPIAGMVIPFTTTEARVVKVSLNLRFYKSGGFGTGIRGAITDNGAIIDPSPGHGINSPWGIHSVFEDGGRNMLNAVTLVTIPAGDHSFGFTWQHFGNTDGIGFVHRSMIVEDVGPA